MSNKFFHASPRRLAVGTRLRPAVRASGANYEASAGFVYMTNSVLPHMTVMEKAVREGWHIYQVCPIGKITPGNWDDLTCKEAEVVAYIGTARGIVGNCRGRDIRKAKEAGEKWWRIPKGSRCRIRPRAGTTRRGLA